jgi:hypothetical protein
MAVSNQQILDYLAQPNLSDATIAAAMNQFGVTPAQMAQATGLDVGSVQSRFDAASAPRNDGIPTGALPTVGRNDGIPVGALPALSSNSGIPAVNYSGGLDLNAGYNIPSGGGQQSAVDPIAQLYTQYAGRTADAGGLDYWRNQFGTDVDANEAAIFQRAVAENVAKGVESTATGTNYNPYFTANPDVAAEYMRNTQGMTPEQFAATHYEKFGVNEGRAAPDGALTSLAGQDAGATTDTSLNSNVITDYRGKEYDTATVLNLANQLSGIADPSQFSGGVFGVNKGSVGFDYDQAARALGRDVNVVEQVLLDSARSLIDQGITDLSKLGIGDIKTSVSVLQAYDEDGRSTGQYYASIPTGTDGEGNTTYTSRLLTPEEAARIRTEEITGTGEDAGSYTRQLLDDVVTGRGVVYDGKGKIEGNRLDAGVTYTGKGGTTYQITYDENGKPRFTTSGFSTSDLGTVAPLLQIASFIPGVAPFAMAANAAIAASQGNVFGALASLAGMGGYTNLATGLNVANAVNNKDVGALAGALLSNPSINAAAGSTMLTDTISFADLGNAANLAINIDNGNWAGALNSVGSLTGSSDLKVAASAATIITELGKENPNISAILNATQTITNATSSASNNVNAEVLGGITNRVVDDLSSLGGNDLGSSTYISAVNAGATDEEAMAAANAVTDAGSGVVINKIPDAGPSNVVTTTYGQGGVDTNFGDLEGAIATNAINDATRTQRLNEISNQPKFADAYSQARSLLGSNQTFTWNGKEYSTATAQERPDLSAPKVQPATDESAAETARLNRQNTALVTGNAPDQSAAETARFKSMEKTGFFEGLYKDLNDKFKLQGEAANEYLKNNPNSPITASVSSAFEAAGELQKNLGGVALALDNKPLADAIISGGSKLQTLGQSLGDAPQDTKNWNDTVDLISKAKGTEKLAVLAGRVMDGTSGLARQVGLELRQELPALFLGGGLLKPTLIASGLIDTADTGGAAVVDAYDNTIKKGGTHEEALSAGRKAGAAAAATEAAIQLTLGKLADVAAGKLDNIITKGTTKVAGEGVVEGSQEAGASAAVDLALGNAIDVNKALTQGIVGAAVGKGTATATSPIDAAQTVTTVADTTAATTVANNINTAIASGNTQNIGSVITENVSTSLATGAGPAVVIDSAITSAITGGADAASAINSTVTAAINSGANLNTVVNSTVSSAITAGANVNTAVGSAVTSAVAAGASIDTTLASAVSSAVKAGADVNTVIQAATAAAANTGNNVNISSDANVVTINNATANTNTTVNTATGVTTTVDNVNNVTTTVAGNTSTVVDANANTTSQTKVDGNTQTTVVADANTNTNTQTVVDSKTGTTTSTTVDANNNTTTQTTITGDTQTTVLTDTNTNTQTTVKVNVNTGEVIDVNEAEIPADWKQPVIEAPSVPGTPTATPITTEEDPAKKAARLRLPQRGSAPGGGGAGLPSGIEVSGDPLRSRVTQGKIDPLARVKEAQAELEREVMMNQIDPRLMSVMQQRMDPQQQTKQFDSDIGALAKLLGGNKEAPANEGKYYSYGAEDSIDDILGGRAANYKEGGFVEPLKASGGSMALPLLAKTGGALGHYKGRENFKDGKHVAGDGDGQSDDIPAWLADGEFVFPADVVSALGNGSTKAGTDKLYEMMHSIRDRARSKGPKDLPPPALKSPLDYLKSSKRSTK